MSNPMSYGPPTFDREDVQTAFRPKEEAKFADPYVGSKQDRERAEAVLETLYRKLDRLDPGGAIHDVLYEHVDFLMEVFRAARGDGT